MQTIDNLADFEQLYQRLYPAKAMNPVTPVQITNPVATSEAGSSSISVWHVLLVGAGVALLAYGFYSLYSAHQQLTKEQTAS